MMLLHFEFCEDAVSGFYLFSCRYSVTTTSVSVHVSAVFGAQQVLITTLLNFNFPCLEV